MITKYSEIIKLLENIHPEKYAKDRNYVDGSVSRLSPYISRGVISTNEIFDYLVYMGYKFNSFQKFLQEMIWREFWQIKWQENNINEDFKKQKDVVHFGMPEIVYRSNTKIDVIDHSVEELYRNGYIHNHLRMYLASFITNIAKYHWLAPAQWMYYYLLDADWGSNALSWQWVSGASRDKKYFANQSNINKFTYSKQQNTILDISYDDLINLNAEQLYSKSKKLELKTNFPKSDVFLNKPQKPICIYNFYNLDVNWRQEIDAHRILLIEPSVFRKYPVSNQSINFMLDLSKNINGIKIFVGEFNELPINKSDVYFKEHPLNYNYIGKEDSRDWICRPTKKTSSFFKHWNYVIKGLKNNLKQN